MEIQDLYDLIIVGGGPAGMTAGIYASRLGLKTFLITKSFGGQVAKKAVQIENYPGFESISGPELVQQMEKHLRKNEIEVEIAEVRKVEKENAGFLVLTRDKKEFRAKSIILASGADPRPLEVPGEKEFIGKGVSYCPSCDAPLFVNKTVAVIGGGNAGFETAIFLTKIAKKIYILEYGQEVKALEANQKIVKQSGKAEIITNAILKKIEGKNFVDSIIYEDGETGKQKKLRVEGVFVEIGSQPATSFVKELVDFSERDEIKINLKTCETKTPGLFAAGDVTDVFPKQIVVAAGEGAKAAVNAYKYIQSLK